MNAQQAWRYDRRPTRAGNMMAAIGSLLAIPLLGIFAILLVLALPTALAEESVKTNLPSAGVLAEALDEIGLANA